MHTYRDWLRNANTSQYLNKSSITGSPIFDTLAVSPIVWEASDFCSVYIVFRSSPANISGRLPEFYASASQTIDVSSTTFLKLQ
jgi:hypothetical protein